MIFLKKIYCQIKKENNDFDCDYYSFSDSDDYRITSIIEVSDSDIDSDIDSDDDLNHNILPDSESESESESESD